MTTPATEIAAAPLLTSRRQQQQQEEAAGEIPSAVLRPRTTTMLPLLLGLFAGRRGASMLVRQTAARQLEDWREDWGYSLPVVVMDTMWNFLFVAVAVVVLLCTAKEKPNVPLRLWICVYAAQCVVHVVVVWLEFFRRRRRSRRSAEAGGGGRTAVDGDGSDEDLENSATNGRVLIPN
ncbi:hypothetical protein OSB04_008904 [Centaurea solstitialis]|uniref:RING-type E3 ubiquitin transferase n=1 Tax=Centaurea solstitialis TaxID=347529 RepID=A0AA38TMS7_9ASTR|nr:hypothetical protein OSB04_008904 [Centaurea solstitialis]